MGWMSKKSLIKNVGKKGASYITVWNSGLKPSEVFTIILGLNGYEKKFVIQSLDSRLWLSHGNSDRVNKWQ